MSKSPPREILATLGPRASGALEQVSKLCEAGADWIRINCSHAAADDTRRISAHVRAKHPKVRILIDLQGSKLRVGKMPVERRADEGDRVVFISDRREEQPSKLPVPCRHLVPIAAPFPFARLAAAQVLRMKDATMSFRIVENQSAAGWILAVTDTGGVIRTEKGMNAPGVDRSSTPLPAKDLADARLAAELGADALCVSFVTGASQVEEARAALAGTKTDAKLAVWAKVECREAIEALDAVLAVSDAVLVGRGDLAGELGPENVRAAADEIVKRTVAKGLPCHIGTNVLPGMCRDLRPSADERADVLRLAALGVRGFLLTAETSVGRNPDASIRALREILTVKE